MDQSMKVLFCVRHNFYSSPGGAQIQVLKTIEGLEKLGVACDLTSTLEKTDFSRYDLIHLTDLTWTYDLLEYLSLLRNVRIPKVLSTIYWPFDDYAAHGAPWMQRLIFRCFGINGFEYMKAAFKLLFRRNLIYLRGLKKSYIASQKEIVGSVDWLLPNSEMELAALNSRLGLRQENYTVVNNAIDVTLFDQIMSGSSFDKAPDTITFVGRIDARKNQLNFLKAVYHTPYRIVFIGQAGPNSRKYYRKLRDLAERRGNTEFVSQVPQRTVFELMLTARVNVLTSWIETPGLVSLEALYAGCNIVVTDKGSVREYFGDHAYYCKPDDLESIREAVEMAMKAPPPSQEVRRKIISDYSWGKAAEQTLSAYEKVLSAKS